MAIGRIIGLLVAVLLLIPKATAETVTVGTPYLGPSGTTYPFGNLGSVETYQQLYYASNFSGPMLIESITFFTVQPEGFSVFPGTYELTLSTTSASLYGLCFCNATGNIGQFFSGYLSQEITGGQFTISGNPFLYMPGDGNLLLTITGPGDPRESYTAVFVENIDFALTGAAATVTIGSGFYTSGAVTEFEFTAVPEPTTLILCASGLAFAALRRRS